MRHGDGLHIYAKNDILIGSPKTHFQSESKQDRISQYVLLFHSEAESQCLT